MVTELWSPTDLGSTSISRVFLVLMSIAPINKLVHTSSVNAYVGVFGEKTENDSIVRKIVLIRFTTDSH